MTPETYVERFWSKVDASAYQRGCRCGSCRAAHAAYRAKDRARNGRTV